jgi:tRNA 2-(methylsulfanyl)-N6-isopentenyladenosine37 hydroxylase
MLHLLVPSPQAWLPVALGDLPTLLLDHAHCEMKAAASARMLARRYGEDRDFVRAMAELAAEETAHYDGVRLLMEQRGIAWAPIKKDGYVAHLLTAARANYAERRTDRLLIAAIIEARSCERLGLLADAFAADTHRDEELRGFYRELFESEARHHGMFLEWARHFAGRSAADERLAVLLDHEAAYVTAKAPTAHFHG